MAAVMSTDVILQKGDHLTLGIGTAVYEVLSVIPTVNPVAAGFAAIYRIAREEDSGSSSYVRSCSDIHKVES
jgi:hypothetical protein